MAGLNPFLLATLALLPALAVAVHGACRGSTFGRLAALQLATGVTALMLVLLSFAFDQSSLVDLALTLAVLSLPGTLVYTLFLERWL